MDWFRSDRKLSANSSNVSAFDNNISYKGKIASLSENINYNNIHLLWLKQSFHGLLSMVND